MIELPLTEGQLAERVNINTMVLGPMHLVLSSDDGVFIMTHFEFPCALEPDPHAVEIAPHICDMDLYGHDVYMLHNTVPGSRRGPEAHTGEIPWGVAVMSLAREGYPTDYIPLPPKTIIPGKVLRTVPDVGAQSDAEISAEVDMLEGGELLHRKRGAVAVICSDLEDMSLVPPPPAGEAVPKHPIDACTFKELEPPKHLSKKRRRARKGQHTIATIPSHFEDPWRVAASGLAIVVGSTDRMHILCGPRGWEECPLPEVQLLSIYNHTIAAVTPDSNVFLFTLKENKPPLVLKAPADRLLEPLGPMKLLSLAPEGIVCANQVGVSTLFRRGQAGRWVDWAGVEDVPRLILTLSIRHNEPFEIQLL